MWRHTGIGASCGSAVVRQQRVGDGACRGAGQLEGCPEGAGMAGAAGRRQGERYRRGYSRIYAENQLAETGPAPLLVLMVERLAHGLAAEGNLRH